VATLAWAFWETLSGLQVGMGTLWVVALGGLIFCAGLLSYFRQQRMAFFLFVLPAPVTLLLAVAMGRPIFPRFVFFLMGFGLLITVRGAAATGAWIAARGGPESWLRRSEMAMTVLVTIGAVGFSVRSLPYGYRYPKQDYEQAVEFVARNLEGNDLVALVGKTGAQPIQEYFGKPWPMVERVDQLRALREQGHDVWLIYTFPMYIEANSPALWEMIQGDGEAIGSFEGTIAGGDINVYRCPPLERAGE